MADSWFLAEAVSWKLVVGLPLITASISNVRSDRVFVVALYVGTSGLIRRGSSHRRRRFRHQSNQPVWMSGCSLQSKVSCSVALHSRVKECLLHVEDSKVCMTLTRKTDSKWIDIHPYTRLYLPISIHPSFHKTVSTYIHPSIHPQDCSYLYPSIHPQDCAYLYLSIHPSTRLYLPISIHPSTWLYLPISIHPQDFTYLFCNHWLFLDKDSCLVVYHRDVMQLMCPIILYIQQIDNNLINTVQ